MVRGEITRYLSAVLSGDGDDLVGTRDAGDRGACTDRFQPLQRDDIDAPDDFVASGLALAAI